MIIFDVLYPWIKAIHIIAVISWMAGLLYLPRLFVHHVERGKFSEESDAIFQMMEDKLYRVIMGPAQGMAWLCGLLMLLVIQSVGFSDIWIWVKIAAVIGMSAYHSWLGREKTRIAENAHIKTGRDYRLLNEVPTVLMIVIVIMVIVRPF